MKKSIKEKLTSSTIYVDIKAGVYWKIPVTIEMYESSFYEVPISTIHLHEKINMQLGYDQSQTFYLNPGDMPNDWQFTADMGQTNIIYIDMSTGSRSNCIEMNFSYLTTPLVTYSNEGNGSITFFDVKVNTVTIYLYTSYSISKDFKVTIGDTSIKMKKDSGEATDYQSVDKSGNPHDISLYALTFNCGGASGDLVIQNQGNGARYVQSIEIE